MSTQQDAKQIFAKLFALRRMELGITQVQIADMIGTSQQNVWKWEKGKTFPRMALWKSIKDVTGWIDPAKLLRESRAPNKDGLMSMKTSVSIKDIPILEWKEVLRWREIMLEIRAGNDCAGEHRGHVQTTCKAGNCFALHVENDSMSPEFNIGDIVVVNPDMEAYSGDFIIVSISGRPTIKQMIIDCGRIYLKPLNNSYQTVDITDVPNEVIGVVTEKTKVYRRAP